MHQALAPLVSTRLRRSCPIEGSTSSKMSFQMSEHNMDPVTRLRVQHYYCIGAPLQVRPTRHLSYLDLVAIETKPSKSNLFGLALLEFTVAPLYYKRIILRVF